MKKKSEKKLRTTKKARTSGRELGASFAAISPQNRERVESFTHAIRKGQVEARQADEDFLESVNDSAFLREMGFGGGRDEDDL